MEEEELMMHSLGHCGEGCQPTTECPEDKRKKPKMIKEPRGTLEEQLVAIDIREEQKGSWGLGGEEEIDMMCGEPFSPLLSHVADVNLLSQGKFVNLSSFKLQTKNCGLMWGDKEPCSLSGVQLII